MTILPVVEREMRVAARERNTYRVRFLAAFLTVLFSGFSLWFVTLLKGSPIKPRELFIALTWIEFVFVMIAGFSLTADAISEEKRESTLGLLFLTDLKSYDIVLGKLAAAAIRGIFALIGTFPVLALPLMMGGTNGPEFARTVCSLLVALFFSMAVGLMFSAFLQKGWTAYGISAAVIVAFAIGLPVLTQVVQAYYGRRDIAIFLEIPSPTFALIMSFSSGWGLSINHFYLSLAVIAGISCVLLGSAAGVLPFVWKERPPKARSLTLRRLLRNWKLGTPNFRASLRRRLLGINPVYWLSRRELVPSFGFMIVIALFGLANFYLARREWPRMPPEAKLILPFVYWIVTACLIHFFILLRIPIVAAERFGEDQKSGALELLVSTPLSVKRILRGHWLGLARYFAGPMFAVLFIHCLPILYFVALQPLFAGRAQPFLKLLTDVWMHLLGQDIQNDWENNFALMVMLGLIPVIILSWVSLAYLGTYLSLRVKRPLAIPVFALGLLHAPPWLALAGVFSVFEYNRLRFDHRFSEAFFYYSLIFLFECLSQAFWIWWCRRQLARTFRTSATDRYRPAKQPRWWHMRIA